MTLSELLHKVSFEEICPFLDYQGNADCMALYKMHYDILCHLIPHNKGRGNGIVTVSRYEPEEDEPDSPRFYASSLEGDYWEVCLAKELVIEQDVDASLAEIAACCLWHTSFYGFTESQVCDTYKSWHDNTDEMRKVRQQYASFLPTKKEMLAIRSFHNTIRSEMKMHRRFRPLREFDMFVRKRKWRHWKRYEINTLYRKRITLVASFIEDLFCRGNNVVFPPSVQEMSIMFRANHVRIDSYQTYAYDASKRKEYFQELMEKYHAFEPYKFGSYIICISSSSSYPLIMDEMELVSMITQHCKGDGAYCVKTDDSLGEELRIDVAFYEM